MDDAAKDAYYLSVNDDIVKNGYVGVTKDHFTTFANLTSPPGKPIEYRMNCY